MNHFRAISILFLIIFQLPGLNYGCSMYVLHKGSCTMVGNNEDSWQDNAQIWFENGSKGKFGVVYLGNNQATKAQGGMNEYGLTYDAFTMRHQPNLPPRDENKKDFHYSHIKDIMQTCKTVDEVRAYLKQYNLQLLNGSPLFNGGMLLFADKDGRYMTVEADTIYVGNDPSFLLANFSYAKCDNPRNIKFERYQKGLQFMDNHELSTSLDFCTKLSDTLSVCRNKVGDGTLYSSIYNLEKGIVTVYFYHDFSSGISFDLKKELKKGDHSYDLENLFPHNSEFAAFKTYKTPQNNRFVFYILIASMVLFLLSIIHFLRKIIVQKAAIQTKTVMIVFCLLGIILLLFNYQLLTNPTVFYFDSPFLSSNSLKMNLLAVVPFLITLAIVPLIFMIKKSFKISILSNLSKALMVLNISSYFTLIILFNYWQLYSI